MDERTEQATAEGADAGVGMGEAKPGTGVPNREGLVQGRAGDSRPAWWAMWLPFSVWLGLFAFVPYAGRYPTGDSPHILGICMRLGRYLRTGHWDRFLERWLELLAPHPPGAYLVPSVAYGVFGNEYWIPWVCGALLLVLVWDGVVRMLRAMQLGGAWGVGVAFMAAPLIWGQAEGYGMDLASGAAVSQCLSHLMASRGLRHRRSAVLAGVWLGIGFWTKYTFPIFLFLPCLAVIVGLGWDVLMKRPGMGRRVRNGIWLVGASAVCLIPLGVLKGRDILNYVQRSLSPTEEERVLIDALSGPGPTAVSGFERRYFYLASLKDLWGWPGLALLALGLLILSLHTVRAVWRGDEESTRRVRTAWLGLSAAMFGILALSTFSQKVDRYMLPALFPLAAVLVPQVSSRRWGIPLVLAVMVPPALFVFSDYAGFTQHQAFDAGVKAVDLQFRRRGPPPAARRLDHAVRKTLTTWGRYPLLEEPYRPYSSDPRRWQIDAVLARVARNPAFDGRHVGVHIAPSLPATLLGVFLMRAERMGYHWTFVTVKLRWDGTGAVRADLFQAPFVETDSPTFRVLVVLDTGDTAGGLLSSFVSREGFREVSRSDLGHGRVRILVRDTSGMGGGTFDEGAG